MRLADMDLVGAGNVSLPTLLERRVNETPDIGGVITRLGRLTFLDWHARAAALSGFLGDHLGGLRGERILLWMSSDDARDCLIAMQAAFMSRAIVVCLDDRSPAAEGTRLIQEADPAALMISTQVAGNLGPTGLKELGLPENLADQKLEKLHIARIKDRLVDGRPESIQILDLPARVISTAARAHDDAIIFFSSGSTGAPKGAVWTQGDLVQYVERAIHAIYALPRSGKPLQLDDVLQSPIPVYTAASVMENPYAGVLAGCTVVYETRRFDPVSSQQRMFELGTTIYNAAPPHFAMVCDLPDSPPPPRLELLISGGSAFTPPLHRLMRSRWPNVAIANWYGLMESGVGQTLNFGDDMEREPGALGWPVEPTEARIVDQSLRDVGTGIEGELWLRAPAQMRSYFNNPEQTAKRLYDGWLRTGDLARLDERGLLHMAGRSEERINRGGFKFYPVEIEAVLEEHPRVREASVIAVPHALLGQDAIAFVVLTSGDPVTVADLRQYCKRRIAANKVPTEIFIKIELPRAPYGKVIRRELVKEYEQLTLKKAQDMESQVLG
jgi:acyl-CoA synthetase (AMP-forming)/AMP-acid ligase II